jgi:hypothetical protein
VSTKTIPALEFVESGARAIKEECAQYGKTNRFTDDKGKEVTPAPTAAFVDSAVVNWVQNNLSSGRDALIASVKEAASIKTR